MRVPGAAHLAVAGHSGPVHRSDGALLVLLPDGHHFNDDGSVACQLLNVSSTVRARPALASVQHDIHESAGTVQTGPHQAARRSATARSRAQGSQATRQSNIFHLQHLRLLLGKLDRPQPHNNH